MEIELLSLIVVVVAISVAFAAALRAMSSVSRVGPVLVEATTDVRRSLQRLVEAVAATEQALADGAGDHRGSGP